MSFSTYAHRLTCYKSNQNVMAMSQKRNKTNQLRTNSKKIRPSFASPSLSLSLSQWLQTTKLSLGLQKYAYITLLPLLQILVALDNQIVTRATKYAYITPLPLLQNFGLIQIACSLSPIDRHLCHSISRVFNLSYFSFMPYRSISYFMSERLLFSATHATLHLTILMA